MPDATIQTARMLRYELPVDDRWHMISLPAGAQIRHVASRSPEMVEFWVEGWDLPDDHDGPMGYFRQFRVYGTGQPYPVKEVMYRGTALTAEGALVWHLFELHEATA